MSDRLFQRPLLAALVAMTLAAAPLAAHAVLTSEPEVAASLAEDSSTTFLAQAIAQERAQPLAAASPFAVSTQPVMFVQSRPALLNPLSASLRSSSDAALWNFVAMVHSQQTSQAFDVVETRVNVVNTLAPPVAAVPLPTMTWLMVVTLLGFAGAGSLRKRGETAPSERPHSGAALAA